MSDLGPCDFCGHPVGFYGCPRHGVDCWRWPSENDHVPVAPESTEYPNIILGED